MRVVDQTYSAECMLSTSRLSAAQFSLTAIGPYGFHALLHTCQEWYMRIIKCLCKAAQAGRLVQHLCVDEQEGVFEWCAALANKRLATVLVHMPGKKLEFHTLGQEGAICACRCCRALARYGRAGIRLTRQCSSPARSSCNAHGGGGGGGAHGGGSAHELHTRPLACSATDRLATSLAVLDVQVCTASLRSKTP